MNEWNESNSLKLRPAVECDKDVLIDIFNEQSKALTGETPHMAESFESRWTQKGFSMEHATYVLEKADGEVIGYVEINDVEEPLVVVGLRLGLQCFPQPCFFF